jgi:hypothetical protein
LKYEFTFCNYYLKLRSVITCTLLNTLLGSSNKGERERRHVAGMGEMRNAYKIFVGKLEGNRPFGIPGRR